MLKNTLKAAVPCLAVLLSLQADAGEIKLKGDEIVRLNDQISFCTINNMINFNTAEYFSNPDKHAENLVYAAIYERFNNNGDTIEPCGESYGCVNNFQINSTLMNIFGRTLDFDSLFKTDFTSNGISYDMKTRTWKFPYASGEQREVFRTEKVSSLDRDRILVEGYTETDSSSLVSRCRAELRHNPLKNNRSAYAVETLQCTAAEPLEEEPEE